ncbi:MAG: pyridoxamine 5-phosphate oxidase-related FMN-binding [Alphaproteobacteria bacterium]|nr:pyridoxamine 5-phosphate oxidase-related FMN-binding [Alphaproteobacteria bacterium]
MTEEKKTADPDHIWDLIAGIPMALLITKDGGRIDTRPMAATAKKDEGCIYILANKREDSDREIQADSEAVLSFQKGATYVVVYGEAGASNDRAKIKELWTVFDKAWWDGPEDPRIRLLTVTPRSCEYWESPGKLVAYTDMLISAATGKKPSTGEHGSVAL